MIIPVLPCAGLVRHMFWPREDEQGNGLTKPVADADRRISALRQAHRHLGPRHAVRQPPAASRSLPVSIYSSARVRVPRTPAHIPRTPAEAANAFAVASRSSARPTRPLGPGERGRHGCRSGRRRWDGRRPEAPHVRRRVSPLSLPDSFLPLLLAPPPRSACPPPVPVTRIDICSIFLAPGGGAFVRGCTAACSAGSRGDRNAGTVWVTEAV